MSKLFNRIFVSARKFGLYGRESTTRALLVSDIHIQCFFYLILDIFLMQNIRRICKEPPIQLSLSKNEKNLVLAIVFSPCLYFTVTEITGAIIKSGMGFSEDQLTLIRLKYFFYTTIFGISPFYWWWWGW